MFNNRELAAGIWSVLFILWSVYKFKLNYLEILKPVAEIALSKSIIISFLLLLTYSIGLVFLLDFLGLWQSHQIKNFIFWLLTVSAVYLNKLRDIESDPHYFSKALANAFKITVVFQFMLTVYTFDFWVEFILFPVATLAVVIGEFAKHKDEHYRVAKFCETMLGILGVTLIIFTAYKLATDFKEFGKSKTFYDFAVPTALSVLILPFYYLLGMYCAYERIFTRMRLFIVDEGLLKYAKWRAFIAFNFRFFKLDRWSYSLNIHKVNDKNDVNQSIKRMFVTLNREERRERVPFKKGWSPHEASTYLTIFGLKSNPYKEIEPGLWFASTPYLDLEEGLLPNNIAYYIEGDENAVKKLTLKLNINEPSHSEGATHKFIEVVEMLFWQSLSLKVPGDIINAIQSRRGMQTKLRGRTISVSDSPFCGNGYGIKLVVEVA